MNDAVRFQSSAFSLEPPVENGVSYDLPLGDDIAAFVAERLRVADSSIMVGAPIREDWGTVLYVSVGQQPYTLSFHWLPDESIENSWGIQFGRRVGCLGLLTRQRSDSSQCRPLQELVARVLQDEPEIFTHVEWVSQAEFDKRW